MEHQAIKILGQEITEGAYPKLLAWAKDKPETLERMLLSMLKAYSPKDREKALGSAMANLELELQHDDARTLPEE